MNISLLARAHTSEDTRVHYKIAKSLLDAGHEVQGICRVELSSVKVTEVKDGIKYISIPYPKFRKLDLRGTFDIFTEAYKAETDAFICFEIRTLAMGVILKLIKKKAVVYDCHEYWPEKFAEILTPKHPSFIIWISRKLESFLAKYADLVWTVNDNLAERFRKIASTLVVIPNYPTMEILNDDDPSPTDLADHLKGKKVLLYVGGLTELRGITACLQVVAEIKKKISNIHMLFLGPFGYGYESIMPDVVEELNIHHEISVIGLVDHKLIPGYLKLADLGLFLFLPNYSRYDWTEPIKYFEYTAAGLPVVMSDFPATRSLIGKINNGILVDPNDIIGTSASICDLLEDKETRMEMALNGVQEFHTQYNWERIVRDMLNSLDQLI